MASSIDGIRVYAVSQPISKTGNSFDDLFTFIISKKLLRSLPHKKLKKKLKISKLNDDMDLYTNQKIDAQSSQYHLDHIFEIQCFVHVVASALHNLDGDKHGQSTFTSIRDKLVNVINADFNLNVTDSQANLVKMNIFKEFIKRRRSDSNPSLIAFLRNSSNFDKNLFHFCSTLRRACKMIREQLLLYMNHQSMPNHYDAFKRIIEEFDVFYNSMKIEDYDLLRFI